MKARTTSAEDQDGDNTSTFISRSTPNSDFNMEVGDSSNTDSTDRLLRDILQKVSNLEEINKKVDMISQKVVNIEKKIEAFDTRLIDLENGMGFLESEVMDLKEEVKILRDGKASIEYANELRKSVVDLVNRSKRNNIVLHGIPEGVEGETHDCSEYARTFFASNLNVSDVDIERAHRSPSGKRRQMEGQNTRPRPIHVKLLRFTDREKILKRSAALKDVKIQGSKVGMSDDVHKDTRDEHRRLMVKVKKLRSENKFAFIPSTVPRVIKYKDGPKDTPGPLKTLRIADLE